MQTQQNQAFLSLKYSQHCKDINKKNIVIIVIFQQINRWGINVSLLQERVGLLRGTAGMVLFDSKTVTTFVWCYLMCLTGKANMWKPLQQFL